jgi:hypothetical protein
MIQVYKSRLASIVHELESASALSDASFDFLENPANALLPFFERYKSVRTSSSGTRTSYSFEASTISALALKFDFLMATDSQARQMLICHRAGSRGCGMFFWETYGDYLIAPLKKPY